jgi:hypothetical protein
MALCCHIERSQSAIFARLHLTTVTTLTNVPLRKEAISEQFAVSFSSLLSLFPSSDGENGKTLTIVALNPGET